MLEGEAGHLAGAIWCRLATHYLWKPRSSDQQMVPSPLLQATSLSTLILLLVWKQAPTLQPRLVLPLPPDCVSSCPNSSFWVCFVWFSEMSL